MNKYCAEKLNFINNIYWLLYSFSWILPCCLRKKSTVVIVNFMGREYLPLKMGISKWIYLWKVNGIVKLLRIVKLPSLLETRLTKFKKLFWNFYESPGVLSYVPEEFWYASVEVWSILFFSGLTLDNDATNFLWKD